MTPAAVVESLARRRLLTPTQKRIERLEVTERIAKRQRAANRFADAQDTERVLHLLHMAIERAERAS